MYSIHRIKCFQNVLSVPQLKLRNIQLSDIPHFFFREFSGAQFCLPVFMLHLRHALSVTQRLVEPNLSAAFHFKVYDKML